KNLEICDRLVTGELYIKTPFRTAGYHNDPLLNRQRFIPDPFESPGNEMGAGFTQLHKTGDLGRILMDGTIDVKGRNDRQVKIRGIRVELEEIESIFARHPSVAEAAALLRGIALSAGNDEDDTSKTNQNKKDSKNKLLCVYITLTAAVKEEKEALAALEEFVSNQCPAYMKPGKLLTIEKMPRTPNGKIDYDALPDALAREEEGSFQPPRDRVETRLLDMWSDILNIQKENISVTHTFFQLGGNSLNIMTLISRIHRAFDTRISLAEVFNNPSIRQQANLVRVSAKKRYAAIKAVERRDYYLQSSAQKRLFFLDRFEEVGTSYNMPGVFHIKDKMDKHRYEEIFHALIARHESLRTCFDILGDQAIQRVREVEDLDLAVEYEEKIGDGRWAMGARLEERKVGRSEGGKVGEEEPFGQ
ncbi:MAG: AMP-binding protein, partial [bacterium]|nr:AMP-binding protein [bacterium]